MLAPLGLPLPSALAAEPSSLPVQVLRGLYLGALTGVLPALAAASLGFLFRYVTGLTIPAFGVVALSVAIAGVNGGLLALADPAVTRSAQAPTLVTALLVVMMLSLYAHARGDALGASFSRRLGLRSLRERQLSADVVELVEGRGAVRVRVHAVYDVEGYPPLPESLRARVRDADWTFPADLPLPELERRFADRLRTRFDLAEVAVTMDERGRATVTAAPPLSGVSRRVPAGKRAASVAALVPTGLARGDEVTVETPAGAVSGTVVSAAAERPAPAAPPDAGPDVYADARSDSPPVAGAPGSAESTDDDAPPEATAPAPTPVPRAPTTGGGEGRVTVAAAPEGARTLLRADRSRVVVHPHGTGREFELVSLLRNAGRRVARLSVRAGGPLDGATLADAAVRETYDVAVLAARSDGAWTVAPRGSARLRAGDELFAAGTADALAVFEEAVA